MLYRSAALTLFCSTASDERRYVSWVAREAWTSFPPTSLAPFSLAESLAARFENRVPKWADPPGIPHGTLAARAAQRLQKIGKLFSPSVVAAWLKLLYYSWLTSRRFGLES